MKLKSIAVCCALAFAGQAYAAAPTPAQAAASTVQIFISGSSALQNTLAQIANGIFGAGNFGVFFDGTATAASGKNYRAYAGTFSAAAGTALSGKTGVIYETAKGGSIVGAVDVALATNVGRIDLTTCGTAAVGTDGLSGAPLWSCTGFVNAVPDAGVSDVEPALFTGINVPAGGVSVSPAVDSSLVKVSSLAVPMGIIVTPNSGVTNLTKAQVTGLMNGVNTDWSWVDSAYAPGKVVVCRRVAGSGTQAAINASFFGFPCSTAQQIPATAVSSTSYTVIENASSGAVGTCMTAVQNGLDAGYTISIADGTISTAAADATHITLAAGGRAIGLMGVDRPATTTKQAGITGTSAGTIATPENYSFVNINGVAPTVENSSTGAYDVVVNNSFNKRAATVNGIAPLSGDTLALFNVVVAKSGDKAILGASKTPTMPGVLALADAANLNYDATTVVFNGQTILQNPVMRVSKANNCQPAAQVQ